MKINLAAILLTFIYCLFLRTGPRHIDSASPLPSPVRMEKDSIGGAQFFSKNHRNITNSLAVSFELHQCNKNESGHLLWAPYYRFNKRNQLPLSLQQNFLPEIKLGLYADYRLVKKNPIDINSQFLDDVSLCNHSFDDYDLRRVNIKGIRVSAGARYLFN